MKILNTIQELWEHCLYCPICKESCREMSVSVGPNETFKIISFKKKNELLHLTCKLFCQKLKYIVHYTVNCNDNSFDVKFSALEDSLSDANNILSSYFYFYVQGSCKKCNCSSAHSSDLKLDMENKKIVTIGLDREGVYLLDRDDSFHVDLQYDVNKTFISKCIKERNGEIVDYPGHMYDLIKVNFMEPDRAINKIKIFLTFS